MDSILKNVDLQIHKYKAENKGEMPLYIIVSPYDADNLFEEVRKSDGHGVDVLVTTYKDMKIVKHDNLEEGEVYLSNDLPATGS